jgi:hypothetical protein
MDFSKIDYNLKIKMKLGRQQSVMLAVLALITVNARKLLL